jgi:hypothetical protein
MCAGRPIPEKLETYKPGYPTGDQSMSKQGNT